ncbi:hypothetical protein [Psychromonas sp. Urea-02u-13]|uniref:hypothetical protein n=1 Tax=Psychromonas sp. Urea-02u-13 TaxID=2058326 RepID=UPI0012FF220B|nr:hypothetical protein [Psychromonas sp. Urea-02u-13]
MWWFEDGCLSSSLFTLSFSVIPELFYRESQVWDDKGRSSIKDFEDDSLWWFEGDGLRLFEGDGRGTLRIKFIVIHALFFRHSRVVLSGISGVDSQSRSSIKDFEDDGLWLFEGDGLRFSRVTV